MKSLTIRSFSCASLDARCVLSLILPVVNDFTHLSRRAAR